MATRGGAAALALPVGAIAPGMQADLVLVRLDGFHVQPAVADTVVTNLVHAARGSDVAMVMVEGRVVVEGGCLADPRWQGLAARARAVGSTSWRSAGRRLADRMAGYRSVRCRRIATANARRRGIVDGLSMTDSVSSSGRAKAGEGVAASEPEKRAR